MHDRGSRIFNAFMIIVASTFLFLLPITLLVEDFKVDRHEDNFSITTGGADTTDNVILSNELYEGDTTSITILSDDADDSAGWGAFSATFNELEVTGLAVNTTRTIEVNYDIDALGGSVAIINLADKIAWFWLLICIAYAPASLAAIFTGRA